LGLHDGSLVSGGGRQASEWCLGRETLVLGHLTGHGQLKAPRSRTLPRSSGAARSARCRRRVRSPQASCGLRHLRRAAPASIGSTATARVTVGTATRLRANATWLSGQTRAASRPGVARVAHPVRERRTSSAASFSAGACPWEADRNPRRSSAPERCAHLLRRSWGARHVGRGDASRPKGAWKSSDCHDRAGGIAQEWSTRDRP
jgi:hypothetical protein